MDSKTNPVKNIRAVLLSRGLTLTDFANAEGFNYYTLQKVLSRYWGEDVRSWPKPGTVSRQILDQLMVYVG